MTPVGRGNATTKSSPPELLSPSPKKMLYCHRAVRPEAEAEAEKGREGKPRDGGGPSEVAQLEKDSPGAPRATSGSTASTPRSQRPRRAAPPAFQLSPTPARGPVSTVSVQLASPHPRTKPNERLSRGLETPRPGPHAREHHSATQRGEALPRTTTWMDPENTSLSERSQTQKDTQCVIPLMGNVQNRQIHRHREGVPSVRGWGSALRALCADRMFWN